MGKNLPGRRADSKICGIMSGLYSAMNENPNRARDHLANERTFLAWVRTGVATIGRFSIAIRELLQMQGHRPTTPGITAWLGMISIVGGVMLIVAGLLRYRKTRVQLDTGTFEPAGVIVDLVSVVLAVFGIALAVYLVFIEIGGR
jgi:putative membrane protein